MAKRISFLVHGRVQGVFFRDFTQSRANSYGLTGFVTNTSNGKVAGEAQGEESAIEKLRKDLDQGPRAAHVVQLDIKDADLKEGESSFKVI